MKLSRYSKIWPDGVDPDSVILFSTGRASIVQVPKGRLSGIETGNITADEHLILRELGLFVERAENEKDGVGRFVDELNAGDHIFAAKVVMNLDCNLACRYCFEGLRKGKHYMTRRTADDFIGFLKNGLAPQVKEIRITFYGGEPLLSRDLVAYISLQIKTLADDRGLGYEAYLVTNGTLLTPRIVEELAGLGLKEAVVTIDGPRDIHDNCRPSKVGTGTFDLIFKNLRDVCGMTDIQVGGNYTRRNYPDFPRLLDYMMENGLTPDKLSLVRFDPVTQESEGLGPPGFHDGCRNYNEQWLRDAVVYLREEILRRGYRTNRVVPMACMIDIRNRFVINYDGSICKCPGLIGIEEYNIGNIVKGVEDYGNSHNLDNWKNEECLDCAYLPLCLGGCRYMKLVRDGSMDGVDCRRSYFDATLETMVKQDIKYGMV
jgi:uncharacterized protein